jgi:hypothetical protein
MNYFQPYSLPADQAVLAAWDSQLAELAECPALVTALATQRELFPRFAAHYARLRALPRGTRRALHRKLARAREVISIQPEWQKKLAGSIAGAALLLALAQSASAATITVTTSVPDINDGDGKCSLIEAIVNANDDAATHPDCAAGDGADTIVLPKNSTITVSNSYPALPSLTGLPDITGPIVIQGNGATIAGNSRLSLINVAVTGDVTLRDTTITRSRFGINNRGRLTIENTVISKTVGFIYNSGGFPVSGGAVANTGTLAVINSIITDNGNSGSPEIATSGGGLRNWGEAYIVNSTIANNIAGNNGGISNGGILTIKNSTIAGNTAANAGFQGRIASGGGIGNGGTLTIENSTVSGNIAIGTGAWTRAVGGGIFNRGYLTIRSSTITGNKAGSKFTYVHPIGGGIYNSHDPFSPLSQEHIVISRSIIAGNDAAIDAEIGRSTDQAPIVKVDDFNIFGVNGTSGVEGFTPGLTDIVPSTPITDIFGPLQDNGGPTFTHLLLPGSPALDAAPVDANCPATDQRGAARPQGTACDIGAVEGIHQDEPPPPPPQSSGHNFVVSSVKAPKSINHGGGTAPATVTIRNASSHTEILNDSSVLGDGASTGLVRLAIDVIDSDGEQCQPPAVALDASKNSKLFSKGAKKLTAGSSLTVNFLVTYRCDAPMNKRNPEAGDFSNSASVFPDELDGISDSNATSTLAGAASKVTP